MPEQTFRSPNFFEREIDLSAPSVSGPTGTPAGVIGTSNKGPAFVPVTVANFGEFINTFGNLDPKKFGPYAVNEFLKHRNSLTFLRVLGAGANITDDDISTTLVTGRVKNAGFKLVGSAATNDTDSRHKGVTQFLVARHQLSAEEAFGMPMFTDNSSYNGSFVNLVRGAVLMPSTARLMVLDANETAVNVFNGLGPDDVATGSFGGKFKLVISSTLGNSYSNTDGNPGVRILTASMNPTDSDYFGKILNTDPDKFVSEQHYLHAHFPVDNEIATMATLSVLSGSDNTSTTSGETTTVYRDAYGAFDTRFSSPKTSMFISQPFGSAEYDLFSFEAIDDGEYANSLYKISIVNLKASLSDSDPYGTFGVQIRSFGDTDSNPEVLESFPNCSLNPQSENYVAKLIGDRKVTYNFDSTVSSERRVVTFGKYANLSKYVRIIMTNDVEQSLIPQVTLPFGFRGPELLKTNNALNDSSLVNPRLAGVNVPVMVASILPPVPFRFKVTKGEVLTGGFEGQPGSTELANQQLYWGVKFERNTLPLNSNLTAEKNQLIENYTKFLGIKKLDMLVTASGADTFNNNKFSLANVALSNTSLTHLTASVNDHMREAAYIRNANLDLSSYTVSSNIGNRITLAHILSRGTATDFNRFSQFAKFTNFMYGGFDGVNILDRDSNRLNDKSVSFDAGGGAELSYVAPGMTFNPTGTGQSNSNVISYMTAIDIMTDPLVVNTNILSIPGIRETFITDYAAKKVREYGLAFYILDVPSYDDNNVRLYDSSTGKPDVGKTLAAFNSRNIDNSYVGTYFPNVVIDDLVNKRKVKVPASVAALGALAFNDRVSYPWFAPAGFNRAALDFVSNVEVRLNVSDRDELYDSRINPIATFPRLGFVIYGQKTLQVAKTALDRVNVRRLLLEVKRIITEIAQKMVFEQNTVEVRNKFVADSALLLGLIQTQAGIEDFRVIMNETNNTQEDIDLNRLNGKVIVVPTRVIEYISIDFIITNSGVQFV